MSSSSSSVWARAGVEAPVWVEEPPSRLWFVSSSGGSVTCQAGGSPPPSVTWVNRDGTPVTTIPALRQVLTNGTLLFLPFSSESFRAAVHASTYRCRASSPAGVVLSRDTHVRAVVEQYWEVQVYNQYVVEGNAAVLQCKVPPFVKDFVSITSWTQGHTNYYPSQNADGRIQMVATGQLVVRDVRSSDSQLSFRCRAVHTLTGATHESANAARIYVTDLRTKSAPRIPEMESVIRVQRGTTATLLCPAQGNPTPTITWYQQGSGVDIPLGGVGGAGGGLQAARMKVSGPVLNLLTTEDADAGTYRCYANNTEGVAVLQVELEVLSALSVRVTPPSVVVDAGAPAHFTCVISGSPVNQVTWLKDGNILRPGARVRMPDGRGRVLKIEGVGVADVGVYQCRAEGHHDSALGISVLTLGDTLPVLKYRFIEQTLQPGPSVSLKCIASGSPTPSVTWTLDGFPVKHSDRLVLGQYVSVDGDVISHVNVSNVAAVDGGLYRCSATNTVGTVQHGARLNVYGVPVVRPMDDVSAVAGERLVLTCPVGGYPIHSRIWLREGVQLPVSRRQVIHTNGSLVIDNVQRETDAGTYSCTASTKHGDKSTQSVQVKVLVPPRILPFNQDHHLSEGNRLTLTCVVTEGDLPLTITWYKDGHKLEGRGHATQHAWGDFNSHLGIAHVLPHHAGNYTCRARNRAASDHQTAALFVNVPPRWVSEPEDQSVTRGSDALIRCQTEGFPPPKIIWRKAHGAAPGSYRDLLGSSGTQQLTNGSLLLTQVTKDAEGRYLCEATNGIGAGLSKVIQVTVNAPPRFSSRGSNVSAGTGGHALLRCPVTGDQPMKLSWHKDGRIITPSESYRHELRESTAGGVGVHVGGAEEERVLELVVTNVMREDGGQYVCTADNAHGHASTTVTLLVQEPPDLPRSLHVIDKGSRHVRLAWEVPQDGNSPITKYTLRYTRLGADWQQQPQQQKQQQQQQMLQIQQQQQQEKEEEVAVGGHETEATVETLTPATQYLFTLYAHNAMGPSKPSEALQVTTEGEAPGGPPREIEVTPVSSTSLKVSWLPPDSSIRHGKILAYYITYGNSGIASDQYKSVTVEADNWPSSSSSSSSLSSSSPTSSSLSSSSSSPGGCCSALVTELAPYTEYVMEVQAVNAQGAGPSAPPVTATTLEDVPSSAPGALRCAPMTAHSVLVSWDTLPPAHARGHLLGYRILYAPADRATELSGETTSSVSVALRGLRPYTNYSLQVVAFTRVGEGPPSEPVFCTTEEDVPGPPAGVKAALSRPEKMVVSWLPPTNSNGRLLTYTITIRGRDVKRFAVRAPTTKQELSVPRDAGTVQVVVAASTRVGEGPTSPPVVINPASTVAARVVSWGGLTAVHWEEDVSLRCEAVGEPPPSRSWYRDNTLVNDASDRAVSSYPDGTLVLRDVQRKDSGNYTCRVANTYGDDHITYVLVVQVPPLPPHIHVTRTGATTLTVAWRTGDDGGAPLLGLTVSYKKDYGEWQEETVPPTQTSHELRGLSCGNHYDLYVTAYNKVGDGRHSENLRTKTAGSPPIAGGREGVVSANTSWAAVSLAQWSDGGCPISHYSVAYRRTSSTSWVVVSERVEGGRPLELGGLTPSTPYTVRVTAHNSAGSTAQDYPFTTAPITGGPSSPGLVVDGVYLTDVRVLLPVVASSLALLATVITVCVCIRKKPPPASPQSVVDSTGAAVQDNKENMKQREQYYATVRKTSPHRDPAGLERIPEYADDIYPYATFQMNNSQQQQQQTQRPRLQQPTPQTHHNPSHGHYQPCPYKDVMASREHISTGETYCRIGSGGGGGGNNSSSGGGGGGVTGIRGRHPTPGPRSVKSESEEYDTFGSDSDTDPPASSRTESSNQLDQDRSGPMRAVHHNLIYHAAESSTSTEASPTLPRRSFHRKRERMGFTRGIGGGIHTLLSPPRTPSSILGMSPVPLTPPTPPTPFTDAHELSETECDRDVRRTFLAVERGSTINV
ncbi:cell adhesion molecule Dscam2 isoform X3 [Procambarus clarkii]|uniref:cell adhesion molecule Dscam2 isoform X3 n=1 Tax=Procambarus clarkii TaxID=6728 RepID=UPI003743291F